MSKYLEDVLVRRIAAKWQRFIIFTVALYNKFNLFIYLISCRSKDMLNVIPIKLLQALLSDLPKDF